MFGSVFFVLFVQQKDPDAFECVDAASIKTHTTTHLKQKMGVCEATRSKFAPAGLNSRWARQIKRYGKASMIFSGIHLFEAKTTRCGRVAASFHALLALYLPLSIPSFLRESGSSVGQRWCPSHVGIVLCRTRRLGRFR